MWVPQRLNVDERAFARWLWRGLSYVCDYVVEIFVLWLPFMLRMELTLLLAERHYSAQPTRGSLDCDKPQGERHPCCPTSEFLQHVPPGGPLTDRPR